MNDGSTSGENGVIRALWMRAPLWRFCAMCGGLCMLLFVLFAPDWKNVGQPNKPLRPPEESKYVSQVEKRSAASSESPAPSGEPASSAKRDIAPPVAVQTANPSASAPPIKPVQQPVAAVSPAAKVLPAKAAVALPTTAELSLATANPAPASARNGSGLDAALLGRTHKQSIPVNGFNLPLPAGEWALLANSSISATNSAGMSYFLGRIEKKRLTGAVIVYSLKSNSKPGAGFEAFKGCGDSNAAHAVNEGAAAFDHQSCWTIHNIFTPPWQQWGDKAARMANLTRAAAGDLAAKGVSYPQDLLSVHFYRAEKWGMLDVSYLFSPEAEGIPSNTALTFRDSDWAGPNVQHSSDRVGYVTKLKEWGNSFWTNIKSSFADGQANWESTAQTSSNERLQPAPPSNVEKISPR